MRKLMKKAFAALLALVLVAGVFPATAMTAEAAEGDVSANGYVLFEETFDTDANGNLLSGYAFTPVYQSNHTISDGKLSFASEQANKYLTFTFSDLRIPAPSKRSYVALKVEIFVADSSSGTRSAAIQTTKLNGATPVVTNVTGNITYAPAKTGSASAVGYLTNGEISSMEFRVGGRNDGTGVVVIEGFRVSLVMGELGTSLGQDLGRFLECQDGYFQLQRDMEFSSYTTSAAGNASLTDLHMGKNAVLDLNGHTLTLASGSSLIAANNAKIVDTSAGKTGKIAVSDKSAVGIQNAANPQLPIYTGSAWVFAEPKLEAGRHIMVYEDKSTADKPIVHFRPGFGTAGGENVREAYLADGNSGITMSAFITSTDLHGNKYNLQYNGSEEIVLDDMFNHMYELPENRGQMTFAGFEKYKSLEITLKVTSGAVIYTLPTYTVNNSKVNVNYVGDSKLTLTGNGSVTLDKAITTGAGKLVMEFDAVIPDAMATNNSMGFGFENRGTTAGGNNRYYIFGVGNFTNNYHHLANTNATGEAHIRIEVDLATFAVSYAIDGGELSNAVAPSDTDFANFVNAWNGKSSVVISGSFNSTTVELDNLYIYTITD